jgi:hypothetical protein
MKNKNKDKIHHSRKGGATVLQAMSCELRVLFPSREALRKCWWTWQIPAANKHETIAGGYLTLPLKYTTSQK